MTRRPLLLLPFIALLTAATAACGGASTNIPAGPVTSTAAAAVPASAKHHAVAAHTTKTVTVTVTRTVAAGPTTPRSTPTASAPSFAAFTGAWIGHTRTVTVSRRGRLVETVGDGCCDPIIDLVLQLSNPRRVGGNWVATSRVISASVHDGWSAYGRPAPKPGDRGTVTIGADHILVESISSNEFCDQDKTEPGTCGA